MDVTQRSTTVKRSILAMLAFTIICFLGMGATVDVVCHNSITPWLPFYPNARIVTQEHNFIRPHALGLSLTMLSTPDDLETVQQFYRENIISLLQKETARGLAATDWRAEENPDGGTLIRLYSECGQF